MSKGVELDVDSQLASRRTWPAASFGLAIVVALSGCNSWFQPGATFKTVEGCGIRLWSSEFSKANIERASWDGACKDGLASGTGKLQISSKAGGKLLYIGGLSDGDTVNNQGELTDESGERTLGLFWYSLQLSYGKIYRPDGRLLFDGKLLEEPFTHSNGVNSHHTRSQLFQAGTLYFNGEANTRIENGRFDGSAGVSKGLAGVDPETGRGIVWGRVVLPSGKVWMRWVNGRRVESDEEFYATTTAITQRDTQRQTEFAQARAAREQEREEREDRERQAVVNNITGAISAYGAARQAGNAGTASVSTPNTPSSLAISDSGSQSSPQRQPSGGAAVGNSAGSSPAQRPQGMVPIDRVNCYEYTLLPNEVGYKYFQISNRCGHDIEIYVKVEEDGKWTTYSDMNRGIFANTSAKSSGISNRTTFQAYVMAVCPSKETMERKVGAKLTGVYTRHNGQFGCWMRYESAPVERSN
jgi:hypothetical protein